MSCMVISFSLMFASTAGGVTVCHAKMDIFSPGLLTLAGCYLLTFIIAFWSRRFVRNSSEEEMVLGGRRVGYFLGTMTSIATWIGSGTWSGAAEVAYSKGIIWAQASYFFAITLPVGVFLILEPLRKTKAVTVLDIFQHSYGNNGGALFALLTIATEVLVTSALLNVLGTTMTSVIDVSPTKAVIFSSIFVGIYTSVGSLYAVIYTDIIQLTLMTLGMMLALPYVVSYDDIDTSRSEDNNYFGYLDSNNVWMWMDVGLSITAGCLVFQPYTQRLLAAKSDRCAKIVSYLTFFGVLILATPPLIMGIYARFIDWTQIPSFNRTFTPDDYASVLPLTMEHLTPKWISVFSICALTASTMSSADSVIQACSSCFARNVYKNTLRKKASEREVAWVMRLASLILPILAVIIAISAQTVYYLNILSHDFKAIIMFPHFMILLYWKGEKNLYGAMGSLAVGIILRLLTGIPVLHLPALIQYPGYDSISGVQYFPFRAFTLIVVACSHLATSWLTKKAFEKKILDKRFDIFQVFFKKQDQAMHLSQQQPTDQPLLNSRN